MYTVILTASTLCLLGQDSEYKEEHKFVGKPTFRDIELLQRQFALKYGVELDVIQIDLKRNEIKPIEMEV